MYCKISGMVTEADYQLCSPAQLAPYVEHVIEVFGPKRLMLGSDWPVCTLRASIRQWVTALLEIISSRPVAEQAKLLSENADRLYGLKM